MKRSLGSIMLMAVLLAPAGLSPRVPTALAGNEPSTTDSPAAKPRFDVTDLGTIGGACEGHAISNNGHVAGYCLAGANHKAFLWKDGVMQSLGTLGGADSRALGVNDAGQVVGYSTASDGRSHGFLWQNGAMQGLSAPTPTGSDARAINNAGQIAGGAPVPPDYHAHAYLWNSGGGGSDLGSLDPNNDSRALAINDLGHVAGFGVVGVYPDIQYHVFRWNGSMQDLGSGGHRFATAYGMNDNGDIVGNMVDEWSGPSYAFVAKGGGIQSLGGANNWAFDINNDGLIVGESDGQAILWENGQMKNLNSLIDPTSGWTLQSARAINNKGQIVGKGTFNGQARAFLLKPNAYYWTNPSGGAWHVSTNWDPQGDPGAGDTVIFALGGQYTVDASVMTLAPTTFLVDRMIVSSTGTVNFNNLNLNLVSDSPADPSLQVNDDGIANVNSGTATFSHAIVGGLTPLNPANPPVARLQVFNSGTSLNGTGRLTIGEDGMGELFVTAGGQLTSGEARLGGLLSGATGTAVVGGDGSLWDTGNLAMGYGVSGTLTIENGGRVNSNDAYLSFGALSEDSRVMIEGIGAGTSQASMWALLGSLTVGQSALAFVEVMNGGDLYVSQNVHVTNGGLYIDGRHANGDPSDLDVLGSVFVGGAGSANLLALWRGAKGDVEGDLIIGKDGAGAAILLGSGHTANATQLDVVDPQAGLCAIGRAFDGGVTLDEGGFLRCRNIQLGQAGASGTGFLTVDGGMVRALEVLQVGQAGGGAGRLEMMNDALVATDGTYVAPNGVIAGTGTLAVDSLGLHCDGIMALGISVNFPLASSAARQASPQAPAAAAMLAISGTLTMGPTGRVAIPVMGNGMGLYGSVGITGTASLDGVLALDFSGGFAPKQGDTFTFLTATDGISGTFDSAAISGLMPGFQYDLTTVGGQLVLEALNDGVPLRRVFLPLVRR